MYLLTAISLIHHIIEVYIEAEQGEGTNIVGGGDVSYGTNGTN